MKNMKLYKKALLILSLGLTRIRVWILIRRTNWQMATYGGRQMILNILQLISMVGPVISSLLFLMVHILTGVRT